jgi:hypothetical protein
MRSLLPLALVIAGLSGCAVDLGLDGKRFACADDSDCARGSICDPSLGVCLFPDAGDDIDTPFVFVDAAPDTDEPADTDAADVADAPVDAGDAAPEDVADTVVDVADVADAPDAPDAADGADAADIDAIDGAGADAEDEGDAADGADSFQGPCPSEMVEVPLSDLKALACVDRYEASKADATAISGGSDVVSPPKSKAGVLPWVLVGRTEAAAACAKAGKRLCTFDELEQACTGGAAQTYPYGNVYDPSACNGHASGEGSATETGDFEGCESPTGAWDLSGNVQEWTDTTTSGETACLFGGDYSAGGLTGADNQLQESCSPQDAGAGFLCWGFENPDVKFVNIGFRCCRDPAPPP